MFIGSALFLILQLIPTFMLLKDFEDADTRNDPKGLLQKELMVPIVVTISDLFMIALIANSFKWTISTQAEFNRENVLYFIK